MSVFDIIKKAQKKGDKVGAIEFIIVGLGNPGLQYENTRHNAGFLAIDAIAKEYNCSVNKSKFKALYGDCDINGTRCLLVKPMTYMNLSGESVIEIMNFYKIPIENVVVLHDDVFLDIGSVRIRRKGTDGGQNGIKSIITATGSQDFPRVKIGVGKKPHPDYDLADWVLSSFSKEDKKGIEQACEKTRKSVELILKNDIDQAMNLYTS